MIEGRGIGAIEQAIADLRGQMAAGRAPPRAQARLAQLLGVRRRLRQAGQASGRSLILRTGAGQTLRLAATLTQAGISAWTPQEVVQVRRPRSHEYYSRPVPMLPTFVFASEEHQQDLIRLAGTRGQPPHPAFSFLRLPDGYGRLSAGEMDRLRSMARKAEAAARKRSDPGLPIGTEVRLGSHGMEGMTAVVIKSDGTDTVLDAGGIFGKLTIETFQLLNDPVGGGLS